MGHTLLFDKFVSLTFEEFPTPLTGYLYEAFGDLPDVSLEETLEDQPQKISLILEQLHFLKAEFYRQHPWHGPFPINVWACTKVPVDVEAREIIPLSEIPNHCRKCCIQEDNQSTCPLKLALGQRSKEERSLLLMGARLGKRPKLLR
jgi:hypothetical protein